MARLQNKVALITGAASGIGLACAQRYTSEGAVVIGTDIQDREDWCSLVGGDPENALYKLDVTDGAAQKAIADDLITRFGRIDILLTAAVSAPVARLICLMKTPGTRLSISTLKGPSCR